MASLGNAMVSQPAPDFQCHAIVDGRIKEISLSSYTAANHWLVLVFFPKAWSFICPTEIRSFSGRLDEFLYARTCAVVFASTDSEYCLRAWNNTSELEGGLGGVHVPLISDNNHKLSRDYGVLDEEGGIARRALFIIDPKGIIRCITIHDADIGRSVDEVQRILDALVFTDEYGEGCPVNWKKGDKGIDIASKSKVEGHIELEPRRSWTDWARPKLQRAWSGASQRSSYNGGRMNSHESISLPTLASFTSSDNGYGNQQRPTSTSFGSALNPPYSPTDSVNGKYDMQLDKAMTHLKMDAQKLETVQPGSVNAAIGTAN